MVRAGLAARSAEDTTPPPERRRHLVLRQGSITPALPSCLMLDAHVRGSNDQVVILRAYPLCRYQHNRYALTVPQRAMRQLFDVTPGRDHLGNAEPLPAIYPKHRAPVVRLAQEGSRELTTMHWGFPDPPQRTKRTGARNKPRVFNNNAMTDRSVKCAVQLNFKGPQQASSRESGLVPGGASLKITQPVRTARTPLSVAHILSAILLRRRERAP